MADVGVNFLCNSNCVMCTINTNNLRKYQESSFDDICLKISKIPNEDRKVLITGGEPTIRKDILSILSFVNKVNPNATIDFITNGRTFSNEKFLMRFKKIKNLYVISEFHHYNALEHDKITRAKDSFKQTFAGVKNLIKHDFDIELRMVVSKLNYMDLENIAKLYVENFKGVKRIVIFPIDIIGNAYVNKDIVLVKITKIIPFLEKAIDLLVENNFEVVLYHIPYCVIHEKYHKYIKKGITVLKERIDLLKRCNNCQYEEICPRIWKTYLKIIGDDEFRSIPK